MVTDLSLSLTQTAESTLNPEVDAEIARRAAEKASIPPLPRVQHGWMQWQQQTTTTTIQMTSTPSNIHTYPTLPYFLYLSLPRA